VKQPADTKVSEEGGGGGVTDGRAEILLHPMEQTLVMQVTPLQSMEEHSGADIHTMSHGGPQAGAGGYALKEDAARAEPTREQAF